MSGRVFEAVDIPDAFATKLAYLPGGRDREARPILVVNVSAESQDCSATKTKLERLLEYLLSIFNEETKKNGLCLIVDARRGSWRVARSYIRRSLVRVGNSATRVIVIRPDGFWEKRVDNCTKSRKDGEPIYIPVTRLDAYAEAVQLPYDLGGTKFYDHAGWIQTRVRVEEYTKTSEELLAKMLYLREKLCSFDAVRSRDTRDEVALESYWIAEVELAETAHRVLLSGRNLVGTISEESSQDFLDTLQRIHAVLNSIELEQVKLKNGWSKMAHSLDRAREIDELEEGLGQVTNWILGPADSMLNSRCQVGFDVTSSENLRREHEELELECRETYGRYAELLHRIDSVPEDRLTGDIKSQRDFMNFVCRSFATRLERRRNVLITSQRFFRLASEYFDRTSEVFDKLVMGNRTCTLSQAGTKLRNLQKIQNTLDGLLRELVKEGEKLSDILSMPVKDALGGEVQVDYGEDIANIRDILDATNARKNIFNDSVELRKLTLKQVALIYAYENDAEQAITWLSDLFESLVDNHVEIGCDTGEIQTQKEEHLSFRDTAKGTFDYGCQLVNGSRVLRISCRLGLESNTSLSSRLREAWSRLHYVGEEQLTRLRVCAVFHRSVDEHFTALGELIDTVEVSLLKEKKSQSEETCRDIATPLAFKAETLREVLESREKLLPDVGRTVRLGKLLRTRLKEPLYSKRRMSNLEEESRSCGNVTAVDAISERLAEVTRLAEKLDERLYEAGARIRGASKGLGDQVGGGAPSTEGPVQPENDNKKNEERNPRDDENAFVVDIEAEESHAEDYATATDCTTTPIARSRSESFVTTSECEDRGLDALAADLRSVRQETAVEHRGKREAATCGNSTVLRSFTELDEKDKRIVFASPQVDETKENFIEPRKDKSIVSGYVKMGEPRQKQDGTTDCDIDRMTATSIIEKVEEKSGKIVKEVTETTTLKVSHDTRFGVASYTLTSNALRETHEHADLEAILNVDAFGVFTTNGIGSDRDKLSAKDDISNYNREEFSLSDVNSVPCELEHGRQSKFTKIIRESSQREVRSSDIPNETSGDETKLLSLGLECRINEDSGIEMTSGKSGDVSLHRNEDLVDSELFGKMKTVSRSPRIIVGSRTITNARTIH